MKRKMIMKNSTTICVVFGLLAMSIMSGSTAAVGGIVINPLDAAGLRCYEGSTPLVLNFLAIKIASTFEDRSALEFDFSSLSETVPLAMLDVWVDNIDPGLPDGIIDVFSYSADGVITASDFFAGGTPFASEIVGDEPQLVRFDVTTIVNEAVLNGGPKDFVGFRLSTYSDDRFNVGSLAGLPGPVVTIVPEPGTVCLLGLGGLVFRRRRKV